MEYIHHYDSPLGGITMASDGKALTGLWFDGQKYFGNGLDNNIRDESLPVFADRSMAGYLFQWQSPRLYSSAQYEDNAVSEGSLGNPAYHSLW